LASSAMVYFVPRAGAPARDPRVAPKPGLF
jgi:hypothetical protein